MLNKLGKLDKEALLSSKHRPTGQDLTRHLQVLYFINWQIFGIKKKIQGTIEGGDLQPTSRKQYAMNVARCFGNGVWVQRRILKHEKSRIQKWRIPTGQQWKNVQMICMLKDEGTMIAVHKCIAIAGASIYPKLTDFVIKIQIFDKPKCIYSCSSCN